MLVCVFESSRHFAFSMWVTDLVKPTSIFFVPICSKLKLKIGLKVGLKVGLKIGLKIGLKVGLKISVYPFPVM